MPAISGRLNYEIKIAGKNFNQESFQNKVLQGELP